MISSQTRSGPLAGDGFFRDDGPAGGSDRHSAGACEEVPEER